MAKTDSAGASAPGLRSRPAAQAPHLLRPQAGISAPALVRVVVSPAGAFGVQLNDIRMVTFAVRRSGAVSPVWICGMGVDDRRHDQPAFGEVGVTVAATFAQWSSASERVAVIRAGRRAGSFGMTEHFVNDEVAAMLRQDNLGGSTLPAIAVLPAALPSPSGP